MSWERIDSWGHRLHLPRWIMRPLCDYTDISLGMSKKSIIKGDYKGKAPWWLSR